MATPIFSPSRRRGRNDESLAQTEAIVRAGKHVWYDKPAGDDWSAWQRVVAMAEKAQLQIQMGYMFRYHAGFRKIADWARSGHVGKRVFDPGSHVYEYTRAVPHGDQCAPGRDFLRPRRSHARPGRLDARPAVKSDCVPAQRNRRAPWFHGTMDWGSLNSKMPWPPLISPPWNLPPRPAATRYTGRMAARFFSSPSNRA